MSDVDMILAVLRERSVSLDGWAWAYDNSDHRGEDGAKCRQRAASFREQSRVLAGLVEELECALLPSVLVGEPGNDVEDWRRIVMTEMTGWMNVFVLPDRSPAVVRGQSIADHHALLDPAEGRLDLGWVVIPPRDPPRDGSPAPRVDVRHAYIERVNGRFRASIHNSLADAEAAKAAFDEEHTGSIGIDNNVAERSVHPVLIPRRVPQPDPAAGKARRR